MMTEPLIKETDLQFSTLTPLIRVSKIVIHHTGNSDEDGNPIDDDLSAAEIHRIHQQRGWSGIGYHLLSVRTGPLKEDDRKIASAPMPTGTIGKLWAYIFAGILKAWTRMGTKSSLPKHRLKMRLT